MKYLFSILFIAFVAFASEAQIADIFADEFEDSPNMHFGIVGDYDINSNAITNAFTRKFYAGGYINEELKNSVLDRVKNNNRVGGNVNTGIYYAFKLNPLDQQNKISLFFSVRDRAHFDAAFSKDLFKVGFYGNSQYAGTTANLSNFNVNLIRYQQIQAGVFSAKLDSAARWGVGVSFLKGEQYLSVSAKKAELFTSADGQYIDLNTELSMAQSDTANKGVGAFNGYGASIDLYFEAPFQTRFGNCKINVSVSDLGAIRFNNQTMTADQDSLFHFSGFQINSIYDLQDSTFASRSKDSIKNAIAPFKKQAYSVTLPSVLNLTFETRFNKYFLLTEGIRYVFNGNYKLLLFLKGDLNIKSKVILSTTFGYGGYGTFNYGLGVSAKLYKNFVIRAGSSNIEGFISPKNTSGQGAYVSLIKNFN